MWICALIINGSISLCGTFPTFDDCTRAGRDRALELHTHGIEVSAVRCSVNRHYKLK